MARQHRNRDTFRPWWRPALWWALMTLVVALLNTYVPGMWGRPFLVELRSSAVTATMTIAGTALIFAVLDWRDRRRESSTSN